MDEKKKHSKLHRDQMNRSKLVQNRGTNARFPAPNILKKGSLRDSFSIKMEKFKIKGHLKKIHYNLRGN